MAEEADKAAVVLQVGDRVKVTQELTMTPYDGSFAEHGISIGAEGKVVEVNRFPPDVSVEFDHTTIWMYRLELEKL